MVGTLRIHLLGDFRLLVDDRSLHDTDSPRQNELLAYLALHQGVPQHRQLIAFKFWPDSSERQARTNLRKTLFLLRKQLPDPDTFVQVDRQYLWLRSDAPCTIDVVEFRQEIDAANDESNQALVRGRLARAIDLYTGQLLAGCYDEWVLPIRERLHQDYMRALDRLVDLLEGARDYQAASNYARRTLVHDPLHEAAYLRLMRLYALQGDRARSLRVYHECATILRREMGVDPAQEIQDLYSQLLSSDDDAVGGTQEMADMSPTRDSVRLIGRQQEWNMLRGCWEGLRERPVQVVVIGGEAGIGKTRLAQELTNWAQRQGYICASSRAYAAAGGLAFAPISDWLRTPRINDNLRHLGRAWLSELARLLPELLDEHPGMPRPQPFTEDWQRQRLYAAMAHGLLSGDRPLLLTLDDLQWCDVETQTWLYYLLRFAEHDGLKHYPNMRLLLICTYRDNEIEADHPFQVFLRQVRTAHHLTETTLYSLSEQETEDLAKTVTNISLPSNRMAQLFADTGGNPLYVIESVRAADHQPAQSAKPGAVAIASMPPPKVLSIMRSRLVQLSENAREIVGIAAVIGRAFPFELLASASRREEDDLVQGLEELWKRRIIQDAGDMYDFSHDRLRDVAYADLSRPRRRLLHRRVAEALPKHRVQNRKDLEGQIGSHYEQAGMADVACAHYLVAGEAALENWVADQALDYFQRANELAPNEEKRALGAYGMARARFLLGQRRSALDEVDRALCLLADPDHELRPRLLYLKADILLAEAKPEMSEAPVQEALAVAERIGDQDTVCQSLSLLGQIQSHRGDLAAETRLIERALAIAQETGNRWREARTQVDLAFLYAQMGRFADAYPLARSGLTSLESSTDRSGVAFSWNILGRIHGGMGRFDQAFDAFENCRQVAEEIDLQSMYLQIPNMQGWLHRELGDYRGALALDSAGVEAAVEASAVTPAISARLNLCHDRLCLEGPDAALHELHKIADQMAEGKYGFHSWRWRLRLLYIVGHCHLQLGNAERVLALTEEGFALARRTSARKYIALNHELAGAALALDGRLRESASQLEAAVEMAQSIDCRPAVWPALLRLANVHMCSGDSQRADACISEAERIISAIAEDVSDPDLRAIFQAFYAERLQVAVACSE